MLTSDYGLTATSPEAYVAIAVEDLFRKNSKETLHANGELTKEYLGMIALYAIKKTTTVFEEKDTLGKLMNLSFEAFDPENMSDNLVRCLKDIINNAE